MELSDAAAHSSPASRFTSALGCSVVLHLVLLLGVRVYTIEPAPAPLQVKLVNPPKLLRLNKQSPRVVSPSKAPEVEKAPDTNQLSDKNRLTVKEQINRGSLSPAPAPQRANQRRQQAAPAAIVVEKPRPKSTAKTKRDTEKKQAPALRLAQRDIAMKVSPGPKDTLSEEKVEDPKKPKDLKLNRRRLVAMLRARPFQRMASQYEALNSPGIPDYLPEIPDGDITLLNAKADRFAVFVRRVALQVFGAIRQKGWQELSIGEIYKLRRFSTIHAVMSPKGELLSVSLAQTSGSRPFDVVIQESARKGTWDQNPPEGAAGKDGNIHFIFKARSWARAGREGMGEQRWLLLGTGLL